MTLKKKYKLFVTGLPPELYAIHEAYPWRWGRAYCRFKAFLTEATSTASVLTIAALTIERYVAIRYPMKAQQWSSPHRVRRIIIFIWIFAGLSAIAFPILTDTYYSVIVNDAVNRTGYAVPESLVCNVLMDRTHVMRIVLQISTFLFFVAPMTLILILYIEIGRQLRRSAHQRCTTQEGQAAPHSGGGSAGKVVPMLGKHLFPTVQLYSKPLLKA